MRTARALTVSPSMLCAEGVSAPRGCLVWGGGVSSHALRPCEQNHTRLWKHNLALTSLRAVKIGLPMCMIESKCI